MVFDKIVNSKWLRRTNWVFFHNILYTFHHFHQILPLLLLPLHLLSLLFLRLLLLPSLLLHPLLIHPIAGTLFSGHNFLWNLSPILVFPNQSISERNFCPELVLNSAASATIGCKESNATLLSTKYRLSEKHLVTSY